MLIEQLAQGKIDIMIGRLFERQDKTGLRYERLAEEPVSRGGAARASAAERGRASLSATVEHKPWIVPPAGSVLRHRFDLMFSEAGLAPPSQLIETASLLFVTKMLQQTDFIAVVPTEVARYYATYGMVAHPADATVLHDGCVRHHHAHRLVAVARGHRAVARAEDFGGE